DAWADERSRRHAHRIASGVPGRAVGKVTEELMDTHVKVLGVLHIAMGAIGIVLALLMMAVFGGVAGIAGASGDPDAAVAIPIIGITGMTLVVLMLACSLPAVVVGIGLYRFRPWARVVGIV